MVIAALMAGLALSQDAPASSQSGRAALFGELYVNWNVDCDLPGVRDLRLAFDITLDGSGRIVEGPTPVRPRSDPVWRAAAESGRRALLNTAPFDVPQRYAGGAYRPTFDFGAVCAASGS